MSLDLFVEVIENKPGVPVKARPSAALLMLTASSGGVGSAMLATAMERLKLASASNSGEVVSMILNITLQHHLQPEAIEEMMETILELAMQHPEREEMLQWVLALVHHNCTNDLNIAQFYDFGALDVALSAARRYPSSESIVSAACAVITHFNCFPLGDGIQLLVSLLAAQGESERASRFITSTLAELTSSVGGTTDHTIKMIKQVADAGALRPLAAILERFPESPMIQGLGTRLAANVASSSAAHARAVEESGIVALVSAALRRYPWVEPLHTQALHLLSNVASGSATILEILDRALAALRAADGTDATKLEAMRTLTTIATIKKDIKPAIAQKGGFTLIVAAMENPRSSSALVAEACNITSQLVFDSESLSTALTAAGAAVQTLKVMERFAEDEAVQTAACAALGALSYNNAQAQQVALDNNGARLVVDAMKKASTWKTFDAGAMAIGTMCWNNDLKAAIVEEGGLRVLCAALQAFMDQPSLAKNACRALAQIAFNSERYRIDMGALGAIPLIIKTMQKHPQHDRTQMHGCVALSYLSWTNESNAREIAQNDGYRVIVQAMKNHPNNADVQENACRALANISSMTTSCGAEGLNAIIDAMALHDRSAEVQEEACRAIVTLSLVSPGNKDVLESLGAAQLVINAMRGFPRTYLVQQEACNALAHLAYEHAGLNKQVTNLDGVALILAAMKAHPGSGKVQLNACGALSALAFDNPTAQMQIFDLGGVEAVIAAMQKFDRMRMLELGCSVLGTLAWNPNIKEKVAITAIPSILDAMRAHADTALLQKSTCRAISQFAFNSEKNRQLLYTNGAIPLICKSLRSHITQDKLVAHALVALTYLCWENSDVAQSIIDEGAEDLLRDVQDQFRGNEKLVNKAVHLQKILTRKSGQSPQPSITSPPISSPQPGLARRDRSSKCVSPQPESAAAPAPPSPPPRDDSDRYYLGRKPDAKKSQPPPTASNTVANPATTATIEARLLAAKPGSTRVGNMILTADEDWCIEDELRNQRRGGRRNVAGTGRPLEDAQLERTEGHQQHYQHHRDQQQQQQQHFNERRGGGGGGYRGGRGGGGGGNVQQGSTGSHQNHRSQAAAGSHHNNQHSLGGGGAPPSRGGGGGSGHGQPSTRATNERYHFSVSSEAAPRHADPTFEIPLPRRAGGGALPPSNTGGTGGQQHHRRRNNNNNNNGGRGGGSGGGDAGAAQPPTNSPHGNSNRGGGGGGRSGGRGRGAPPRGRGEQ